MYNEYKVSFKSQFTNLGSLNVFRVGRQQCPKNFHRGFEYRDFFLLHYVIAGKGLYYVDNTKYQVEKGQAFLIYPHTWIDYRADAEDPWEYCWVGFNGADARLLMDSTMFRPDKPVAFFGDNRIQDLILNIYNSRGAKSHSVLMMTSRLYELISFLVEIAHKEFPSSPRDAEYVEKARIYIDERYNDHHLSVVGISQHLGLSRSRLFRAFKKILGISPLQYLTEQRIREACVLLARTEMPISEIAYRVGFENSLYFSKVFREKIRQTPSSYRRNPSSPSSSLEKIPTMLSAEKSSIRREIRGL